LHLLFNTENTFLYFERQWKPLFFNVCCNDFFVMLLKLIERSNVKWSLKAFKVCFILKTIIKEIKLYYFNLYFVYQDLAKTMAGFLLTWHRSSRASGPAGTETPESRSRFRSGKSCSATPATRSKTAKAATTSITRRLHSPSAKMILKFFVR
jgi:hypothetical protein